MSASISVSGFIKSSGVTVENEPIVKSDGASSEVFQWLASTGTAHQNKITIDEDAGNKLSMTVAGIEIGTGNGTATNVVVGSSNPMGSASFLCINNTVIGDDAMGSVAADEVAVNNVAVGSQALKALTTGDDNVAIGYQALYACTTSTDLVAVGSKAAQSVAEGAERMVAIGALAGATNVNGDDITAVGYEALNDFTGSHATAVGSRAADKAMSQTNLTAVGSGALGTATSGNNCTAIGKSALGGTINGGFNTAVGVGALAADCADYNTAVGVNALDVFTGSNATAIGYKAAPAATTAAQLVAVGMHALNSQTADSTGCIAVGFKALYSQDGNVGNAGVGWEALYHNKSGTGSTALGSSAGYANLANYNTWVGHEAGRNTGHIANNTAIGYRAYKSSTTSITGRTNGNTLIDNISPNTGALASNQTITGNGIPSGTYIASVDSSSAITLSQAATAAASGVSITAYQGSGAHNTCVGYSAGEDITTGSNNILVGSEAGEDITTGIENVIIGKGAGKAMTANNANVVIGYLALDAATGGEHYNIAIGSAALTAENSNANYCVAIGKDALAAQNGNVTNIAIGGLAGDAIVGGNKNTLIGHEAGTDLSSHSNTTCIGYQAGKGATSSNSTVIGSLACATLTMSGGNNTAVGYLAGTDLEAGSENTLLGGYAGTELQAGAGNVMIGYKAGAFYDSDPADAPPAEGTNTVTQATNCIYIGREVHGSHATTANNEIVIGYKGSGNGNDSVTLGNHSTDDIHCADTSIAGLSDRRVKRDITDNNVGLAFIESLATINYKRLNPADWPDEISGFQFKEVTRQELVTPAVEAADAVYEDVLIPAVEEVKGERHKHDETEVTEEVEKVEMVKGEGDNYIRKVTTETVTRVERTPLYVDHPVVNEDGTPCVNEDGSPVIHQCPVMEEYVVQEAQEERTERRLVSPAVEAQEAVYETVTVPADERPADNDKIRLGLIAQDVQTAMADAGVDFDLVAEGANGKLSLKYGNLVIPLLKAVQELSAEVKALKG